MTKENLLVKKIRELGEAGEYEKQGREFLTLTNTTMEQVYLGRRKHFPDDKEPRDCFQVVLKNERGFYSFTFGDSLVNTEKARNSAMRQKPSAYSVLACLTKSEPEQNVDAFASEYGYEKPSEAIHVHKAVLEEWEGVQKLWTPEQLLALAEIN